MSCQPIIVLNVPQIDQGTCTSSHRNSVICSLSDKYTRTDLSTLYGSFAQSVHRTSVPSYRLPVSMSSMNRSILLCGVAFDVNYFFRFATTLSVTDYQIPYRLRLWDLDRYCRVHSSGGNNPPGFRQFCSSTPCRPCSILACVPVRSSMPIIGRYDR